LSLLLLGTLKMGLLAPFLFYNLIIYFLIYLIIYFLIYLIIYFLIYKGIT